LIKSRSGVESKLQKKTADDKNKKAEEKFGRRYYRKLFILKSDAFLRKSTISFIRVICTCVQIRVQF
jgi:hypothetical protein